jgi:hypothetical protein
MSYAITAVLFATLTERRITAEVARMMCVSEDTLRKQLRPDDSCAKFGADDLIPLCEAMRRLGYGHELAGILHEYVLRVLGELEAVNASGALQDHVMNAVSGLGGVIDYASDTRKHEDEREISRSLDLLRTKILPAVAAMEATLDQRLKKLRAERHSLRLFTVHLDRNPTPGI